MTLNDEIQALNRTLVQYGEKKRKLASVYSVSDANRILSMFGGMGSLNDMYICQMNGHKIEPSDEVAVNQVIRTHLTNIHKGCMDLVAR